MEGDIAISELSGADYQVFLSFRGPDTRQGFTDCLYHFLTYAGIRVFKDDTDHPLGSEIEKIMDAISFSLIGIPIFSKEYASSKWCLKELTRMVKLKKTIIPIFYDVTPNDVKLKTELYRNALYLHESEDVEDWKNALQEVGNLSGRELRNTGFGEFCIAITAEVLKSLRTKDRIITGELVAVTDQVEAVLKLLDADSPDVRFVGIHGMGGIGKTTLAKLIFNELSHRFQPNCSFIDGIRELSKTDPMKLQQKLLTDLQWKIRAISDPEDGVREIRDVLRGKKVLIVLDDVDHREQIDMLVGRSSRFGSGSRIIITTRDKSIIEHDPLRKFTTFEMLEMNYPQALQLFSRHAFKEDFPPSDYAELSSKVISAVGRLPLALEIIGSHLHGKQKDEWQESIRKLARVPHKDVQSKLRLSYNSLDYRAQQIFLDIACFFNNKDKKNAVYMWEACKFHPDSSMAELISMSLIKVSEHDKLWMHDQLRDLGREIVCLENFFDFGKRSRLWEHKEAMAMLKKREGTRKVQALCLSEDSSCFGPEELHYLRNLRFVEWFGIKLQGDLTNIFSKLIWFSWHACPSHYTATCLNLESIVVLELLQSNINEYWEGWRNIQVGDDLRVLDLTGCGEMTRTPDISKFRTIERLTLEDCGKLVEIDGSIGRLKRLKYLNLKGCHALKCLPDELCSLDALEEIIITRKDGSFMLPERIGDLTSLMVLEIVGVHIDKLPVSISKLVKLEHLSLCRCSGVKELPGSIGNLSSLVRLDLSETDIERLPNSIGELSMLQLLIINSKGLRELPNSLGDLKSLIELDLSWARVTDLPDSIGQLGELKVLKLGHSSIHRLPKTTGKMGKLEELHVNECHSMEKVPTKIKKLLCLRFLNFSGCDAINKVPSLRQVSSLQTLLLEGCHKLSKLPKLPESLTTLDVASSSLRKLPDFSKLDNLNSLKLSDRSDDLTRGNLENSTLEGIEKLSKLRKLHLNLSNVTSVPTNFSTFVHLKELVIACPGVEFQQVPKLPSTLSHLRLEYIDVDTKLPCLKHLKILAWLQIQNCSVQDGFQCLGIQELHSLVFLSIAHCRNYRTLENMQLPKSLKEFRIHNCDSLQRMPKLSGLQKLELLYLADCRELTEISGLGDVLSMESLTISDCSSLAMITDLSDLQNLKHLKLVRYPQLTGVPGLGNLHSLETIEIYDCHSISKLSNMSTLMKLEELEVKDCPNLKIIEGIKNLHLRVREIEDCSQNLRIT